MGRLIIVGGGFAGADLARRLVGRLPADWTVHLYSAENHIAFTPLLPEVVGASINPLHVVWPLREMAPGAVCRTAEVRRIDPDERRIEYTGPDGEILRDTYDQLVICCGLAVNLDIVPGLAEFGWPLKSLGDALALRNHVIQQLERAEAQPNDARRRQLLSFVVVGGGFTGVEVASSLRDVLDDAARFYSRFSAGDARVIILEGGPKVLGPLPDPLSEYARRELIRAGIEVRTGTHVKQVRDGSVELDGDEAVDAATVIASVGTSVRPLLLESGFDLSRGRLVVGGDMRLPGREDVWALGDCAAVPNAYDDSISPTLGQFATRQSARLAENLLAAIGGRPTAPFSYHMRGMFASLGHGRAVGNPFGFRITGFPAYFLWRGIYLLKMPSVARRIQIAFDWAWSWLFRRDIVELNTMRSPHQTVHDESKPT